MDTGILMAGITLLATLGYCSSLTGSSLPTHRLLPPGRLHELQNIDDTHFGTGLILQEHYDTLFVYSVDEDTCMSETAKRKLVAEVCLNVDEATLRTQVFCPERLLEESAALEARAADAFGIAAGTMVFDPLAPVAALVVQRIASFCRDPPKEGVHCVDEVSEQALRTARHQGLVLPSSCTPWPTLSQPHVLPELAAEMEIVDWVSMRGDTIAMLPRKFVHLYNILHRGIGAIVRRFPGASSGDAEEEIYVHQRSSSKRVFPSMYDMFVGGVALAGEKLETTVVRELEEELNIAAIGPPPCYPGSLVSPEEVEANHLRFLFDCIIATSLNRCRVRVFDVAVTDELASTISFQASEVQGGEFESLSCVKRAATESLQQLTTQISSGNNENGVRVFVPDGLAVWNAYLEWQEESALTGGGNID